MAGLYQNQGLTTAPPALSVDFQCLGGQPPQSGPRRSCKRLSSQMGSERHLERHPTQMGATVVRTLRFDHADW